MQGSEGAEMSGDRLRYRAGEARAQEMYAEAESRVAGRYGPTEGAMSLAAAIETECVEVVALGLAVPGESELRWLDLLNESTEPWHDFLITDDQMRAIVGWAAKEYPGARVHAIWHSHYVHNEPGGGDISTFPEWLAGVGIVYHAPTSTSHVYDNTGILFTITPESLSAR